MRPIPLVLCALLLTGCSSFQADPEDVRQVPSDRLLAFQQPVPQGSRIVVTRDLGMLGGGCYITVLVDRQPAARLGIGEQASFAVAAGERILGIGADTLDDSWCGKGSLRRERLVRSAAGATYHYRVVSESVSGFGLREEVR